MEFGCCDYVVSQCCLYCCVGLQMVADAYKAELTDLDEQQRVDLAIERLRAQDAVRDLYLSVVL